mgnify:CR=1 FL=1
MKSSFVQLGIAFVICIVTLIGYGFWYNLISAKSATVTTLQKQIDAKTTIMNNLTTTQAALAEVEKDEAVVQSYFVPETGAATFFDNLQALGRSLGTTLKVLSASTNTATSPATLTLAVSITGTFDAVMRTVGAVEYAPYDLSISNLSIGHDGKNNWHADMGVLVGSTAASAVTASTTKP